MNKSGLEWFKSSD